MAQLLDPPRQPQAPAEPRIHWTAVGPSSWPHGSPSRRHAPLASCCSASHEGGHLYGLLLCSPRQWSSTSSPGYEGRPTASASLKDSHRLVPSTLRPGDRRSSERAWPWPRSVAVRAAVCLQPRRPAVPAAPSSCPAPSACSPRACATSCAAGRPLSKGAGWCEGETAMLIDCSIQDGCTLSHRSWCSVTYPS